MEIIDSHCHIHDKEMYGDKQEEAYKQSVDAGVAMICVGTDIKSSMDSIEFCRSHKHCYSLIGIHPHEAKDNNSSEIRDMVEKFRDEIVGIGEIGLDYYYENSPRERQIEVLREQLAIARDFNLPVSFHVRNAFDDFWPIFDEFSGIRGVLHSFTDNYENYLEAKKRGLYIGINGISTFTRDKDQIDLYKKIPLEEILLETDAPFLTPSPFRGKMNISAYVKLVAEHQAKQRETNLDDVIRITTENVRKVFGDIS